MFQVGDRIIMNELANDEYGYTKSGSTGTILNLSEFDFDAEVKFDLLTGYPDPISIFWVDLRHCDPLITGSLEERVVHKIKEMENRWLAFQSSKKAPCHV